MNEIKQLSKDQVVIEKQAQQEKQNKLIGRIRSRKGQTIFEVNLVTAEINEATYETPVANYTPKTEGKGIKAHFDRFKTIATNSTSKKIRVNKDCIYVPALNLKNLKRKLLKAGFIDEPVKESK